MSFEWKGYLTDSELFEIAKIITTGNITPKKQQRILTMLLTCSVTLKIDISAFIFEELEKKGIEQATIDSWKLSPILTMAYDEFLSIQHYFLTPCLLHLTLLRDKITYCLHREQTEKYIAEKIIAEGVQYRDIEQTILSELYKLNAGISYKPKFMLKNIDTMNINFYELTANDLIIIDGFNEALREIAITCNMPELQMLTFDCDLYEELKEINRFIRLTKKIINTSIRYNHNKPLQNKRLEEFEKAFIEIPYKQSAKFNQQKVSTSIEDLKRLITNGASKAECYEWLNKLQKGTSILQNLQNKLRDLKAQQRTNNDEKF